MLIRFSAMMIVTDSIQTLFNRHSVKLFSQNHPGNPNIDVIARGIHMYGHLQLHLTGHIRDYRRDHADLIQIVQEVRKFSGLPMLEIS
jgi:hypothetical protein